VVGVPVSYCVFMNVMIRNEYRMATNWAGWRMDAVFQGGRTDMISRMVWGTEGRQHGRLTVLRNALTKKG
jgi:hypothetical protein